jgi:putative membrane-bound dehydrogenase-like protein
MRRLRTFFLAFLTAAAFLAYAQDEPFTPPESKPLSPREEQMTFKLPKGLRIELVASEPDVVDPVALAFDARGRLFVAEMIGYPNEGVGTGVVFSGRIRLLSDRDSDGIFETSQIYADKLRLPNGVFPWRNGLIVCNAPQIQFFEDTDDDGKADKCRVLYEGFDLGNIQQMVNGLTYGLDNWVYGVCGSKGGVITCPEKPDFKPLDLRGGGIRFKPDIPGSLERTSGGGQFGLAQNEWGDWFVNTNANHLRHIVLEDRYLARNPALAVGSVTLDISDHGSSCKVHRISPFEAWRVERTRRRKGTDPKRFSPTELVPGGFVTSGCSPLIYMGGAYGNDYEGNSFICDPANNLIHRDRLEPKGATYVARRADESCEFLASTDNWFRPVHLTTGPDGCIYIADFYREVIETPLSLPEDMKQKLNLQTRGRGRIWRIVPEGFKHEPMPDFTKIASRDLVKQLESPNGWRRTTAQRLLVERQDNDPRASPSLLAAESPSALGRMHALWTLQALPRPTALMMSKALSDPDPRVRVQALRMSEGLKDASLVFDRIAEAAEHEAAKVRFQAALSLGSVEVAGATIMPPLVKILRKDAADPWTQIAILSSVSGRAPELMEQCLADAEMRDTKEPAQRTFLNKLAQLVGSSAKDNDLARILPTLVPADGKLGTWQVTMLEGISQGLYQAGRSLESLWETPTPALADVVRKLAPLFAQAAKLAEDQETPLAERVAAIRLIGFGPSKEALAKLPNLWSPQQPQDVQIAAVRAVASMGHKHVAAALLESYPSFSPAVRREATEGLMARPERIRVLLAALKDNKIQANLIEPARLDQLRKHPDAGLRAEAVKLLAGQVAPVRAKVVEQYRPQLDKLGDVARGKLVFQKNCAACHKLDGVGVEVGADLQAALVNKTPEQLLVDIFDPSREVDPRFLQYVVTLNNGRVATGLIASETAGSVTLRRAEKQEETILRSQIDTIQSTAKSLMPEGLETQLSPQDFADLVAYLKK